MVDVWVRFIDCEGIIRYDMMMEQIPYSRAMFRIWKESQKSPEFVRALIDVAFPMVEDN